jgi:hypothetical protein
MLRNGSVNTFLQQQRIVGAVVYYEVRVVSKVSEQAINYHQKVPDYFSFGDVRLSQLGGLKISKASSMPGEKRTSVKADA